MIIHSILQTLGRALLACLSLGLLCACSIDSSRAGPTSAETTASADTEAVAETAVAETPSEPPVLSFISPRQELMYKTLLAELAVQRGQYAEAAEIYLELARRLRNPQLVERATQLALQLRDYPKAEQAAQLWLELEPRNPEARQVLVAAYLHQRQDEAALQHLNVLLDDAGVLDTERLELMLKLLGRGHERGVTLELLDKLVAQRPKDVDVLLLYAHLLAETEDSERALSVTEQVLKIEPSHPDAVPLYVQLLRRQNNPTLALGKLKQLLKHHPDNRRWREIYARLLVSVEDYEASLAQFGILLKSEPQHTEYLYTSSVLAIQVKRFELAQEYLQRLIKYADSDTQRDAAYYLMGELAEARDDVATALEWYRKLKPDSPNYFTALARSALLLVRQEQVEAALRLLREAGVDSPEDRLKLLRLESDLLVQQERYSEALASYDRALEEFPDHLDLLYLRGMVGERLDRIDIMEQDLRRVLELDPANAEAMNALGYTLADKTERYQEALDLIQQALKLKPDAHHILDSMGWVLYRLQRYPEALEYLQLALQKQSDPEIAAHLGEVLWVSGDRDNARRVWAQSLEQFPDDPALLDVMRKFGEPDALP